MRRQVVIKDLFNFNLTSTKRFVEDLLYFQFRISNTHDSNITILNSSKSDYKNQNFEHWPKFWKWRLKNTLRLRDETFTRNNISPVKGKQRARNKQSISETRIHSLAVPQNFKFNLLSTSLFLSFSSSSNYFRSRGLITRNEIFVPRSFRKHRSNSGLAFFRRRESRNNGDEIIPPPPLKAVNAIAAFHFRVIPPSDPNSFQIPLEMFRFPGKSAYLSRVSRIIDVAKSRERMRERRD